MNNDTTVKVIKKTASRTCASILGINLIPYKLDNKQYMISHCHSNFTK